MFPKGGQTRKHCFLAVFPEGGQTRKHCFLAMFPEGVQTKKHCFLAMFPEGGQTRKHCCPHRLTLMQEPQAIFGYPDFLLKYNKG
jgi:hypothetical protein